MSDKINLLTDEQAVRAVKLFYDRLPDEVWEDGSKPSAERVRSLAEGLRSEATADCQPLVEALMDEQVTPAQAAVCRVLLNGLAESDTFRADVDAACDEACQPHMAIDPATGAFLVLLLVTGSNITISKKGIQFEGWLSNLAKLPLVEMLEKLPGVISALPKSIIESIFGKLVPGTKG
ncbi:MAG: hypothetical protein JW818_21625 [Pirellulales bacterium]|nr:hypothetical protein [Pirellulales bacterium]